MSYLQKIKRAAALAGAAAIVLTMLLLCGCNNNKTTEPVYELNEEGTGYLVNTEGSFVATTLTIPSEYEGLPVLGIKEKAFRKCKNLESVVISFDTRGGEDFEIGASAFKKCSTLRSVTIQGVGELEISDNAFSDCTNLTSVDIEGAKSVSLDSYSFEYVNDLTISIRGADVEIDESAFFEGNKECSYSLSLTDCTGEVLGDLVNLHLVGCRLEEISGTANNLLLDDTVLPLEGMYYYAKNAVFRNTVVYHNNYKDGWLISDGGIIENLVIESIGEGSEFSQKCSDEYYPLANNITLTSAVTEIPSGVFGNVPLSALKNWEKKDALTVTYQGARAAFEQLPYNTLQNENLLRGEYTLKCADGQPATITFVDGDGNTVATVEAAIGSSLDYDTYAPYNTTLVPGEIIEGYFTDAEHTKEWVIDGAVMGDTTVYVDYVDTAALQEAALQKATDGLDFTLTDDRAFTLITNTDSAVTLLQITASLSPSQFATLAFFGDAEGTLPAPELISELGTHYLYAHVTSFDKSKTSVYTLEIVVKNVYEVSFISDGTEYRTYRCTEGVALSFPANPSKRGHTFLGWSTDGTEDGIISQTNYVPTENHTLTAVFEEEIYTLSIEGSDLTYQVTWGQSVSLPASDDRAYYAFKGYEYNGELIASYTGASECYFFYNYEESITVKQIYEPIRYNVTLYDGGVGETIYYTVEDDDVTLPDASREWYSFVGWFTEENGEGEKLTVIDSSAPKWYSLYAHFELATYTVTFLDGESEVATQTFNYNDQTIVLPPVPQKDGYTSEWESFSVTAESFTVAVRRVPIVYTITYANTAESENKNPSTYTVEDTVVLTSPTREHYDFNGWLDASGQSLTSIPKGSMGDITLTAQWEIAKYTVYMFTGDNVYVSQRVEYNTEFDFDAAQIPTATDKLFAGWYSEDYTEQISGKITVTGNVSVYAKWLESIALSSAEDFEKIRENPTGTFHLACDVDMRGEIVTPIDDFGGILDGMGFKLYNFTLKIDSTLSEFGLFKVNSGTVRNLTLQDVICAVNVDGEEACIGVLIGKNKGTVSGCQVICQSFTVTSSRHVGVGFVDGTTVYPFHIGGLVGKNENSVTDCSASITLTARFEPSVYAPGVWEWHHEMCPYIGGLVGTNNGSIRNCSASSKLTCTGQGKESGSMTCARNCFYIGGLVGINNEGFTIEKCYASTEINATTEIGSGDKTQGKIYAGAFAGKNSGILKQSYATGSITAYALTTGYLGGFVGNDSASSNISNCYTTATVTGTQATNVGGFVGVLSGTVQNSYATGAVSTQTCTNTAGFVGVISSGGIASKCFTTSNVQSTGTSVGIFCSDTSAGTGIITNCYYSASATVLQNGVRIEKAEESGAKRDYLSNITNQAFLQGKMYFYPEYWIFTTSTPVLAWEIQTDGTTLTDGTHYYCASCGEEFINGASGTHATMYYDMEASCESDGIRYFGCEGCNKHFAIVTQSATGHSYTNDAAGKDFCGDDVLVTYVCQNAGCNHTYQKQFYATGHRHEHTDGCIGCGYTYIAPSCDSDGAEGFICDDCGREISRVLPAEHVWEFASWDSAPSCTEDGQGTFVCTRCLENGVSITKKSDVAKSALGHVDLDGDGLCDRDGCGEPIYDETEAIEISTAEELIAIGTDHSNGSLEKTYILTADIDLTGVSWEPIGTEQNPFTGVFLGGGYCIKNVPLFASDVTLGYGGLFGYNSGVISNLTIQYDSYEAQCTNRSVTFGGIAAFNNGTINRCTVTGKITLSLLATAEVNENGASATASQSVAIGLVTGVNNGFIVGCDVSAEYSFVIESYALMGEEIDHVEVGLLTSGAYKNMTVSTVQTVVAGAICASNNRSISSCSVSGTGTVSNSLAMSQFTDGRWGFLYTASTQSLGTIAGNEDLVGVQNNTHTGTLTYENTLGTYAPSAGNDPGNNYYSMTSTTAITIYD